MAGSEFKPAPEFCIECYTYGIISSGATLILGPPGSGKTSLAKSFIKLALQNGQPLLVLSTQTSPVDLQVAAERMKEKIGGVATIVDCYSKPAYVVGNLISQSLHDQTRPFIIFDSLDGFALNEGEGGALQFLMKCLHEMEGSKATGAATVTTGTHTPKFENMVRTYFRGVLELKVEEKEGRLQRFIRIHSLKGTALTHTEWYEFSITEDGIALGSESYRSELPPRHNELHFLRFTEDALAGEENRALAAIVFTDMAGYTSLAQKDESSALQLLGDYREIVRTTIPKFGGHEVKTMGDGFLLEFSSALQATRCAVEIQRTVGLRNLETRQKEKILVRIGIHVGDVVRKGGDIIGDGVNVASRIEPVAEPGGICVSQQVFDQIQNKLDQTLEKVGKLRLKHVSNPLQVYRVLYS